MVGVPRSKGCHTCRRRKVKCDLGEPSCQRCIKGHRECEGYTRAPVFLNRTAEGLMKRAPLEEAISRRDQPGSTDFSSLADEGEHSSEAGKLVWMPPAIPNKTIYITKLEGDFCQAYVPSQHSPGANPPGAYVQSVVASMTSAQRGVALDHAVRALWMTRLGRMRNDEQLFLQGEMAYGTALRHLQHALYDKQLAAKDKTLAAASILSLYELYESTIDSTRGHDNHVKGLVRLIQWRGKAWNKTLLGQRLTELTKWNAMVHSIQFRQRNPLGDPEWREDSWITMTDMEQRLYDRGLDLGALLEDIDKLGKLNDDRGHESPPTSQPPMDGVQALIKEIARVDDELETWYKKLKDWSSKPLYWEETATSYNNDSTQSQRVISFASLRICHLMLDFWGLHIIVSSIMTTLFSRLPPAVQTMPPLQPFKQRVTRHSIDHTLEIANTILDGARYSLRDDMGLVGPQRSMFGIRVALFFYRITPGEEFHRQRIKCEQLMYELANIKGLKFARDLSNAAPKMRLSPDEVKIEFNTFRIRNCDNDSEGPQM